MHTRPLLERFRHASVLRGGALTVSLALLAPVSTAQIGGPDPGVDREAMWFAPTAEDWKKPVLITFQRTWEDAVAVSRETGKPILICVNMDGEIASEHYAGIRYRQPDKAALYEPYVCVIASVYRHNPRDYDEQGRPITCPRFGSVTCGEHIAIEPVLYEKFFDGQRIAPRHIMVELDGSETYDVFYAWDTDSVFNAIRDGIANRPVTPPPVVRGDRTIIERVQSRDIVDRNAVEAAYQEGDGELRRQLLEEALKHADSEPLGLLRLAVFGFNPELSKLARAALAETDSANSVDLIAEAMRVPMDESEREALVAALDRIGEESPKARTLAVVHRGLTARSQEIDLEGWSSGLAGAEYPAPTDWSALEKRLDGQSEAASARPADAGTQLELAEAALALAVDSKTAEILSANPRTASMYSRLMFEDAHRAATKAEELGASGWRLNAVIAVTAYHLGDTEEADRRSEAAVKEMPPGSSEWLAFQTLKLFAEGRHQAIVDAAREKRDWPREWLTDVSAAYTVLSRHPLGTDAQVRLHYDLLKWLGGNARAATVLDEGLARFPDSWVLHDRLRARILEEQGVGGLDTVYAEMLRESPTANLEWYAGYAAIVAAEFHRRRGESDEALAAYHRAIAHYQRAIEMDPATRDTAEHYIAVVLAGRSRIAFERGEFEQSLEQLLESFQRKPEAAATLDGLNISGADTSRMLRAKFTEIERVDLLSRLDAALADLDPELLQLPAYETSGGARAGRGGGRRGGRRGRRGGR